MRLFLNQKIYSLIAQATQSLQRGDFSGAEKSLKQVLRDEPDNPRALTMLGMALVQQGKLEDSVSPLLKVTKVEPANLGTHYTLANVLLLLGQHERALEFHEKALVLDPKGYWIHINYGISLSRLSRQDEAIAHSKTAIALQGSHPAGWSNLGNSFRETGNFAEAIAAYDQAISVAPDFAEAYYNRGIALYGLKQVEAAIASYNRAIALRPDYAEAYFNLGDLLREQRMIGPAIETYGKLYAFSPDFSIVKGQLLHTKLDGCDWQGVENLHRTIEQDIRSNKKVVQPFVYQAISQSEALLRQCAEIYSRACFPAHQTEKAHVHRKNKINIGYLCGEFRHQATALLMVNLFELHDKSQFNVFAFDSGWNDKSETRQRLEAAFDEIVDISTATDEQACEQIRRREIDILINLNGFFGFVRQGIFARRPSPIQVNYLGFPGTIGADYIDYLVADQAVIPESSRHYYSEKVVYLPDCYQVNDRRRPIADKQFSREELGLPVGRFVYCCFNNNYKISPSTFDGWMRILKAVDHSVLWLLQDNAAAVTNLKKEALLRGVDPDRLIFADRWFLTEHLARHQQADLFLDTLPYNAHTTASDALWAGLPVLTCVGQTFPGRVAASLLKAIEMPELIAHSQAEYEALAIALATHPGKLLALRKKLSENRLTTPLFDTLLFTRHLEAAYERMVERDMAGLAPDHLSVSPLSLGTTSPGRIAPLRRDAP